MLQRRCHTIVRDEASGKRPDCGTTGHLLHPAASREPRSRVRLRAVTCGIACSRCAKSRSGRPAGSAPRMQGCTSIRPRAYPGSGAVFAGRECTRPLTGDDSRWIRRRDVLEPGWPVKAPVRESKPPILRDRAATCALSIPHGTDSHVLLRGIATRSTGSSRIHRLSPPAIRHGRCTGQPRRNDVNRIRHQSRRTHSMKRLAGLWRRPRRASRTLVLPLDRPRRIDRVIDFFGDRRPVATAVISRLSTMPTARV